MFGRDKLHDEIRGLRLKVAQEKDRCRRKQQLLDFAQGCMDADKLRRERDEAQAERDQVKRERDKARNLMYDAQREARHLERRLELMNAEPMRYVVHTEGREVAVTAVTHEAGPDEELVLFDRDEAMVAAFNTYSGFRIEPLPAE